MSKTGINLLLFLPIFILTLLFFVSLFFVTGFPFDADCTADGVSVSYMWIIIMFVWYIGALITLLVCAWVCFKKQRKTVYQVTLWSILLIPVGPIAVFFTRSIYCDGMYGAIDFVTAFLEDAMLFITLSSAAAVISLVFVVRCISKLQR